MAPSPNQKFPFGKSDAIRRFKHFTGQAIFAAAAKSPEGYKNHNCRKGYDQPGYQP